MKKQLILMLMAFCLFNVGYSYSAPSERAGPKTEKYFKSDETKLTCSLDQVQVKELIFVSHNEYLFAYVDVETDIGITYQYKYNNLSQDVNSFKPAIVRYMISYGKIN